MFGLDRWDMLASAVYALIALAVLEGCARWLFDPGVL